MFDTRAPQALLPLRSKCCCSLVFEDKLHFGHEPLLPLWLFLSQSGLVSYQGYKLLRLMTDPAALALLCPAELLKGWVWRWAEGRCDGEGELRFNCTLRSSPLQKTRPPTSKCEQTFTGPGLHEGNVGFSPQPRAAPAAPQPSLCSA